MQENNRAKLDEFYDKMDDINDYEEQIIELAKEITAGTSSLSSLRGDAKSEKVFYLTDRINRIQQVYASFNVEMHYLNSEEAKPYQQRAKEYSASIQKLQADLNWAKAGSDRNELLGPGSGNVALNIDSMGAMDMISTALNVQDDSIDSLKRSERMVESAKEIGVETSVTLKEQTEQINRVDENLDNVNTALKRADKLIRMFLRRLMTDKIIAITVLCIIILVIIVLLVKIFASKWVNIWSFNTGSFNLPWE